jgi:hypothetical protein
VYKSIEAAQSGYEFAKKAQDLCTTLTDGNCYSEEVINTSIKHTREIAKNAHTAAMTTMNMFRANRSEFIQVWQGYNDKFLINTRSTDPGQCLKDS